MRQVQEVFRQDDVVPNNCNIAMPAKHAATFMGFKMRHEITRPTRYGKFPESQGRSVRTEPDTFLKAFLLFR